MEYHLSSGVFLPNIKYSLKIEQHTNIFTVFCKSMLLLSWQVFSEFILKLGQGLCSPAHDETFFSPATIKQAVSVVTLVVSATQLDWQSRVTLLCSDWPPSSINGENRNCQCRVGVLANRKAGWVEGHGRLYAYTHTNTHAVVVKLRGLDMLHKMLTCHYIPPTVFSLWLASRGK